MSLGFTGERIVPGASDCEPTFAQKMFQEHLARYAFAAQFAEGKDVLDVGCGVGYGSQWLGKSGARSVLGFDISADAVEHARHHYFHPAVRYEIQDATAIEAGDGYDLITCFELIEHIAEQKSVLDLIKGALRPEGKLIISTPRPLDDIRTHFHVHEMSFEELHGLLKQRFKHVEPFFEVNCFTSFVGRESPSKLDQIVKVSDKISLDNADYFVFIASDAPISEGTPPSPMLTLNDDSYVLTLEKDVGVLRKAEDDYQQKIAALEADRQGLNDQLKRNEPVTSEIRSMVEEVRDQVSKFTSAGIAALEAERAGLIETVKQGEPATLEIRSMVDDIRVRLDTFSSAEMDRLRVEASDLRAVLLETQNKLATAESRAHARLAEQALETERLGRETARIREELQTRESELDHLRRVLSQSSRRVAELETEANSLRSESRQMPEMAQRCSALESEINAMRYRLDYAESTLARFRGSLSWALTRPVRWIGRTFKKLAGRS